MGPLRDYLTRGEGVDLLLKDDVGKYSCHTDGGGSPPRFMHHIEHARVMKLHVRAIARRGIGNRLVDYRIAARDHASMTSMSIHDELRLVVGATETERDEPRMQKAGMVGIFDVFHHELPVPTDALPRVALNH